MDASGQLDHHAALTGDDLRDFVNQRLFPYLERFKERASGSNTIEYKIPKASSHQTGTLMSWLSVASDSSRGLPRAFPGMRPMPSCSARLNDYRDFLRFFD